ncbi:unnamed protein product [Lactuca saligna]|uniref:Uncharacterized protein n=1 Tax=Lactuca saligna TaxID=75948 RepID=A0AA36ERA1_LACSI|nr:unnamed protein product [Lactuca saligna]
MLRCYGKNSIQGIQVPEGEEVVFCHLQIPKSLVDDPEAFPVIGRISEAVQDKKQVTKPMKKKKKTVQVTILDTPDDDEATYTEDMDLSKGQYSQSHRDANAYDVNHLVHDAFHHDTPPVSPLNIATIESNT